MKRRMLVRTSLVVAGLLGSAIASFAGKPNGCENGRLMETRSFSERGEAAGFANSQSGSATINGVRHTIMGMVDVAKAPVGNLVYVAQIWDCPIIGTPPAGGGPTGGGPGVAAGGKDKVTYTLDPHPELDRNGKPRNQNPKPVAK